MPWRARGRNLDEWPAELRGIVGDRGGFEYRFPLTMLEANVEQQRGRYEASYEAALRALDMGGPNDEFPVLLALRSGIAARNEVLIRRAASLAGELRKSGGFIRNIRLEADGAIAALEGRTDDAVSAFRAAHAGAASLGVDYDAAHTAVSAQTLVPDHPQLRPMVAEARALLQRLDAAPLLRRLDGLTDPGAGTASAVTDPERTTVG